MKRSFREPKNLFKNKAKNDRRKMNSCKSSQFFENKGNFTQKKTQKAHNIARDTAQIRLSKESKDD